MGIFSGDNEVITYQGSNFTINTIPNYINFTYPGSNLVTEKLFR